MADFVENYNHAHRHTGIGLNTPADVHYGLAAGKALERSATLAAARAQHPERFSTTCDPKILTLHETVWINKPEEDDKAQPATKLAA
jgi:putative transposase